MADEGSATVVAFIGVALMIGGSIMNYNIAGEDCDDELDRYGYSSDEYEDCSEELSDQSRLASLIYSAGYPVLLFSLALAIINRR
jgi:hypothetical protein